MASHLEITPLPAELSEKAFWSAQSDLDLDSRNPVVATSEFAYQVIVALFVNTDTVVIVCRPQV